MSFKRHGPWGHGFPGKGFHRFGGQWSPEWLEKLVESGKLTQEEADDYQAWLDARPEIDFAGKRGHGEWGDGFRDKDGYGPGGKR